MKKIPFLFILISLCLVFSESPSYGFALNISPSSVEASVIPGGATSGTITVTNNGKGNIGIRAYAEDWLYSPEGIKSFYGAGTTPFSCAQWIRLFPKKFELEAGGKMGVQYTINVPEEAEGGYYAVIFFESFPIGELEEDEGVMVRFSGRLGSIVYLAIEGKFLCKGDIESLSVTPPQSDKPLGMMLSFKNTGNVHIGAHGILNIVDEEGNIFAKERFGPLNTLPGDTRKAKVEWFGELEEGDYYAIVTLDIGAEQPIVEERKLTIFYGGAIKTLVVDLSSEKPLFSVVVRNTGHLNIDTGGRIELLKEDGELVKILNLKKSLIAPGKERKLESILEEDLANGTYTAKAVISIGDKQLVKEEVFSIK